MTRADNNKRGAHRFLRRWRIVDISMRPQFISAVAVKWILELPRPESRFPQSEIGREGETDPHQSFIPAGATPAQLETELSTEKPLLSRDAGTIID